MSALQGALRVAARGFATSGSRVASKGGGLVPASAKYKKIQEIQSLMTRNDGLLVWQKRGLRDAVPYQATMFICAAGTAWVLYRIVEMVFKKTQ